MAVTYNHIEANLETLVVEHIDRINLDGSTSFIPCDTANSDYQRYLNPEAEQSTPNL
jgi:hypothetical protein